MFTVKVQEINSDQHRGCQEDDNLLGRKCNEPRAGVTGDLPVVRCAALRCRRGRRSGCSLLSRPGRERGGYRLGAETSSVELASYELCCFNFKIKAASWYFALITLSITSQDSLMR